MNEIISKAALEARLTRYTPGTRVELVSMKDPYNQTLKPGDRGSVTAVDSIGTVFVDWDNGSTLGVAYGADEIKTIPIPMPSKVREEILKLRTLPGCPNMFSINEVQRLAFDNEMYAAVDWIENNRKAYSHFILTGEEMNAYE